MNIIGRFKYRLELEKLPKKTREMVTPYFEDNGDSDIIDFYLSLKKDLRLIDKFRPEMINLKLHDVMLEADEEDYEMHFNNFCEQEYRFNWTDWLGENDIKEEDWYRCGSSFIPLREDYYTWDNSKRDYLLYLDSYTLGCSNMDFLDEVIEGWVTSESIGDFLGDMEKIYFEKKLFTDPGLVEKKEQIEEFLEKRGIDSIRDQLKDELIDYYKVIRYVRWYKKHQVKFWNEYLENIREEETAG